MYLTVLLLHLRSINKVKPRSKNVLYPSARIVIIINSQHIFIRFITVIFIVNGGVNLGLVRIGPKLFIIFF